MVTTFLTRLFGSANQRQLKRMQPIVAKINSLEAPLKLLTDEQLTAKTVEFRERLAKGTHLDDLLPEAFAVTREAAFRAVGQRHFDVQLMGGIALHQGSIAEMKTGEGKTLTATLALYLNALPGKGAHLVTVNDYLARRDAEWMTPIFNLLGMSVGVIQNAMNDTERRKAYECDILYATNNELGFDYLRDNMKFRLEDYVQGQRLNFAIVDEVDSILIDEARTPLIISGGADASSKLYTEVDRVMHSLQKDVDYELDEKLRNVQLTEAGNDKVEKALGSGNMYAIENINILHHVTQALRAHTVFKRDVDYVVKDGEVLIVDEFTGRILSGRRYSDGLHQALEAKEGVDIERETQTLASITLQNFFRLYDKLAGMTGTAMTEAEEFHKIYKLGVVSIPTNRMMVRLDKPDLIFLTKRAKYMAIAEDVAARFKKGQPVLIGTISVETSELLSNILTAHGIPHNVLNAKQHAREAEIVEHAGELNRVTIATNMAGRGTDIKLTAESKQAGGLYILGTERHESRRIDNQLRGRSGRQGDVGESRFFISLEDDLIRRFSRDTMSNYMKRFGMKEEETIESPFVSKAIERAQEKVEKHNFESRKHLLEYDDVLNQHRTVVYSYRRDILSGKQETFELIRDFIAGAVQDVIAQHCAGRDVTEEQYNTIIHVFTGITGLDKKQFDQEKVKTGNRELLTTNLINFLLEQYTLYRTQKPAELIQDAEKWLLLETIDNAWKQHMLNIDNLKEGIHLRSWGQKNALVEYKREAFAMFKDMMQQIKAETIHHIFHLNLDHFNAHELEARREQEMEEINLLAGQSTTDEGIPVHQPRKADDKHGRNEPCPCGSGKKFKKCHGTE